MRSWTSVALGILFASLAAGCATTTEPDSAAEPHVDTPSSQEEVTSSVEEDEVNSDKDLVAGNDDATAHINFDDLEEKMRAVLGEQNAISRSSSDLRARELGVNLDRDSGGLYGESCVNAEEEAVDFTKASANHITAIISEENSLTPSNPPDVEWVVVEAFSTLDDAQTAHNLEVTATEACGGNDAQLEETQRSVDGTVVSIVNEMIGEGLFDEPFISSQEVSVQDGTTHYTYRYQPGMSAGFDGIDLSLSNDELFESAGKKLIAISDH